MKVKLIAFTKDPEQVVAAAIRQCYAAVGASELKKKIDIETRQRMIRQVMESGHTSTLEHACFTVAVEGVSRACTHQLVRHRIASYSQQSQRYINETKNGFEVVTPPTIVNNKEALKLYKKTMVELKEMYVKLNGLGIPAEDARFVLPNAAAVKIVITMNARSWLHFINLRSCMRAQWEIRAMSNEILKQLKKVAPTIFENAGPGCISDKQCCEGKMTCGLWEKIPGATLRSRV